ncbi:zinc finger, CCHC-type containing protein [Tanacetum coccineum]
MGDENHIRTLGDYSRPSHEGYKNTTKLPIGNNMVPLRSDTIRLVQNGCSFHRLRSEDPNQHLRDFLKLMDLLNLDGSITTWEDLTIRFLTQFFPPGRTVKLRNDILMFQQHQGESLSEAWTRFKDLLQKTPHYGIDLWLQATIKELARYKDEGWNDPVTPGEGSLDYENPDIEQLLGVMECKVDTLMKEEISLMGRSESIFGMISNTLYQIPSEPSRQEEFENLVMNFILDQEEKVKQLEEYIGVIRSDFMQLSLEVVGKLKEEIRMEKIMWRTRRGGGG